MIAYISPNKILLEYKLGFKRPMTQMSLIYMVAYPLKRGRLCSWCFMIFSKAIDIVDNLVYIFLFIKHVAMYGT